MSEYLPFERNLSMRYLFYKAEDFFKDEYFIQSILYPTAESESFWKQFLAENPHKQAEFEQASAYIKSLRFEEIEPRKEDLSRVYDNINLAIEHQGQSRIARLRWMAAASVIFLLCALGIGFLQYNQQGYEEYLTEFGEIREILLPDQTVVTLNSNSRLKAFTKRRNGLREVWLEGEAFFDVAKMKGTKFIVHTAETDIEVLGTAFNVKARHKGTDVVLNEGSIQIRDNNQDGPVLKPGDRVYIPKNNPHALEIENVEPSRHAGWKDGFLYMEDTPVSEIIEELQTTYGIDIEIRNESLLAKQLSGRFSTHPLDNLMEDLALTINANLSVENKTFILE